MSGPVPTTQGAPSQWLAAMMGVERIPGEGQEFSCPRGRFVVRGGIVRNIELVSAAQGQTRETFGFKWAKRETFESEASLAAMRQWLVTKYGERIVDGSWLDDHGPMPLVLDAGCGAAMTALLLFASSLSRLRYVGVDISEAVDVAAQRFAERGARAAFVQADLCQLPFVPGSVDCILSEGVLHHTDSTERAIASLAPLLKPGGRFMFYVYRRKGPIREFTDDYIRDRMQALTPQEGWDAMMPLTRLGKALGDLKVEIDVPEDVPLLGIPAGRVDVQRLFYWHVMKCFYRPEFTLDEMNHINFDWYAPANAHRQSPEEVRAWCERSGLTIEREFLDEPGITIVARKLA